jgi:probable DNA repair protein
MDSQGPAVVEASSKGGTRIFQLQAACPFRAFAELRLGAKELELPSPGLDRRTRGKLLHGALEGVWNELQNSSELRAKPEVELEELAKRSVEKAVSDSDTALLSGWEKRIAEIEQERLVELILELLKLEKQRPADFKIRELEQKKQFTLGGVTADVKVDRVDELEDGSLVLLDYKSGEPSVKGWEGERLDEPQLPLYATRLGGELSAVAFVQLNRESTEFKGYAREEGVLPGIRKFETTNDSRKAGLTFDELLKAWDATLERLGQDFRAGHSRVDPKARKTCDLCHLGMLCRINEAPLAPEEEENGNGR